MKTLLAKLLPGFGGRRFRSHAIAAFEFLTRELGFSEGVFQSDFFGDTLTYSRSDVAVKVSLDKRDRYLEVYVIRLRDGQIPLYVEEPQDWIPLSNLLATRGLEPLPSARETHSASDDLPNALIAAASALRQYGRDALAGNPSIFAEIARRYPQPRRRREDYVTREVPPGSTGTGTAS